MIKHLISAAALAAAAFLAVPASAQPQARSGASSQAMLIDDNRDDGYDNRDNERSDRDHNDSYHEGDHDGSYHSDRHREHVIRCESVDNRRNYCGTDGANRVSMVNRISDASCVKNRSWGYNGRGIWVDHGCRADFSVRRY